MATPIEFQVTLDRAAHNLREFAELTATHSKNWENYEGLARNVVQGVFEAGAASTIRWKTDRLPAWKTK